MFSRMVERMHLLEISDLDLQVSLRSLDRFMTQETGNVGDVHAVCDQMSRRCVAHRVSSDPFLPAKKLVRPTNHGSIDRLPGEWRASGGEKQISRIGTPSHQQSFPALLKIQPDVVTGVLPDRDDPRLAARYPSRQ